MSRFVELEEEVWIAALPDVVRSHYADLDHRRVARVHPDERLRILPPGPAGPRYERLVRGGWRTTRDVFERQFRPDGSVVDTCVAGAHWGRSMSARFWRRSEGEVPGTLVELTLTQPLRPLVGRLLARWIRTRLGREMAQSLAENKFDVEHGYKAHRGLRVA